MKNYEPNRKRKKFTDWYKSIYDGDQSFSGHEKTMKKKPRVEDNDDFYSEKLSVIETNYNRPGAIHILSHKSLIPTDISTGIEKKKGGRHLATLLTNNINLGTEQWFWMTGNKDRMIKNLNRASSSPDNYLVVIPKKIGARFNSFEINEASYGRSKIKKQRAMQFNEKPTRDFTEDLDQKVMHSRFPVKDTYLGAHFRLIYMPLEPLASIAGENTFRTLLPDEKSKEILEKKERSDK